MRARFGVLALVLGFAVMTVACGAPPTADIDAAKAAIAAASTAGAGDYAGASLKAAEDAQAALDAEMKAQEGKWFKSYDKAKQLAADVKTAGEKAAADAAAGKEQAKADATKALEDAKAGLREADALLAKAPKGKGSAADIGAMKSDIAAAVATLVEADAALANGKFLEALAKSESAKKTAATVKEAVEAAKAAKK